VAKIYLKEKLSTKDFCESHKYGSCHFLSRNGHSCEKRGRVLHIKFPKLKRDCTGIIYTQVFPEEEN